ncbi:MAG TPA: tetratricopeptide repeat protein [Pyrinomonadaceae bacterium]|nr:tetratricopeptide repeat protein [Pyrinomonadaceae bacterium]
MMKTFVLGLFVCAAAVAAAGQDSGPASVYYRDGARFALQGRLAEAARAFEQVVALDPRNGDAFYSLGNVYAEMGRWADAVAAYRKAVSLNKKDVEAFNGLGLALGRRGAYEQAAAAFERAIEIYPKWAEPHFNLSQVRRALGQEPEARASYQRAVRLRPDYASRPPRTFMTAGLAAETEARSERVAAGATVAAGSRPAADDTPAPEPSPEAAALAAPSAAAPPSAPAREEERPGAGDAQSYFNSGLKHGRAGRHEEAVAAFRQAIILDREHAGAYLGLGDAYAELGRWRESLDAYEQAARLNPNDPETHRRLGRSYAKLRETAPASKTAAVETRPAETKPSPTPASASPAAVSERPAPTPAPRAASAPAGDGAAARPDADPTAVYRVGPGDVLDVRVAGGRQPLTTSYKVTPTGLLDHPLLVEPLRVEGLTTDQIAARLGAELKRRAPDSSPDIVVGVREYASHAIIVSGMVREAGTKILQREGVPLYVIIAHAQPLPGAGQALVRSHATGQHTAVDLQDVGAMNMLVRPGDVITVRARPEQYFYIAGGVREPGQKRFTHGLTLTQAVLAAGGALQPGARVRVARQGADGRLSSNTYDLREIAAGRSPDPPVRPDDRIEVLR